MPDRLADELRSLRAAADALHHASRVLISTGAGMSADSGIPTYRDVDGRWRDFEAFTAKGVQPAEVAHLDGYQRDPRQAWAFHEHMRCLMHGATPHRGYGVVTEWTTTRWAESFVLTTNIDGFHRRSGVHEHQLWERYGSIWDLQCVAACTPVAWKEPRAPFTSIDPDTMKADNVPRCPLCDGPARPRVQLDHDPDFLPDLVGGRRYERFVEAPVDVYLVIGTTLWFSWPEGVGRRPTIVHVNPNPESHLRYGDDALGITMGAEDALLGLDFLLRRME